MPDIKKINLGGSIYDIKDEEARLPEFEDYTAENAEVSEARAAITEIKTKAPLGVIISKIKAALMGLVTLGEMRAMLVNNGLCTESGKFFLDAAFGKTLQDQIDQQNSDFGFTYLLNKGTRILAGADMKSDIYKIPGNYYCDLTANVATLQNCPVTSAFILKVEYGNGTSYPKQIFKEYDTGKIISRTYYPSQDRWYDEVTYVRSSDLGKVIINSGTVAAVKGQENEIASITLPAGHKYLVLASTIVSINLTSAIMSCKIAHKSGTAKEQLGATNVRTTMSSGGGITNWYYINTTTDCVYAVCGYGYADAEYDYTGNIIAIQLD